MAKRKAKKKRRPMSATRKAKLARQGRTLKGRFKKGSSASRRAGARGGRHTAEITRPCRQHNEAEHLRRRLSR